MRCTLSQKECLCCKTGLLFAVAGFPIKPISEIASAHKAGRPMP